MDKFVKNIDIEKRQIFCTQDAFFNFRKFMKFSFVSLFPNLMEFYFQDSILARAKEKKLFKLNFYNPRDFSKNSYHKVDDYKIGGGAGLLMQAEPMYEVLRSIQEKKRKSLFYFFKSKW